MRDLPRSEENGTDRGHDIDQIQAHVSFGRDTEGNSEVFGEQPKSSERVKLVMEADKLFLAKMAGEVVGTALLAFQLSLGGKEASSLTTENVDDKTAALSVGSVKVRKDFKISGQIDSKSEI